MFRTDYFLYMAENEGFDGIVDTYEARMNAVINDFIHEYRMGENINNPYLQAEIGRRHGFNQGFTDREAALIEKEIVSHIS